MHEVVAKEMMPLKTLTQDEAVMKMEITDDGGIRETVLSVECKAQDVYVPEAEGWEL